MKAAVCIDDWKLPVFKKHLDAAGYKYEKAQQLSAGVLVLKVEYKWAHKLQPVIAAAQKECTERKDELTRV